MKYTQFITTGKKKTLKKMPNCKNMKTIGEGDLLLPKVTKSLHIKANYQISNMKVITFS